MECLPVIVDNIPAELQALPRWVCWKAIPKVNADGTPKLDKIPLNPRNGNNAKSNDPSDPKKAIATWGTFKQATDWHQRHPTQTAGIGFVFNGDGIVGVDLDRCIGDAGTIEPWAAELLGKLNSYTEVSPSGNGLKVFVRGTLADDGGKHGQVEMYRSKRFFTVTGQHWEGMPLTVNECPELASLYHQHIVSRRNPPPTVKSSMPAIMPMEREEIVRARAYIAKVDPGIMGQHGSNPTFKAACYLVQGFALSPEEAYPLMVEYSERCSPPWNDSEIWHKLHDAKAKPHVSGYLLHQTGAKASPPPIITEPMSPYALPVEPEEFPYYAFPAVVQQFCEAVEQSKKAPSSFVGAAVLAAASAAVGASRVFLPKDDWPILGNLWVSLVGLSGDCKTPVMREVMRPVVEIDGTLEDANRQAEDDFAVDLSRWERDRKQGTHKPKPKPPPPKALVMDNATVESVLQFLDCNPRGLILYRDELTGWFEGMAQYKAGGKGDDRTIFLSLHSNQGTKVNRKNMGLSSLRCVSPYFCALGGMQPSVLHLMKANAQQQNTKVPEREDGLKERLCFAYPAYRPLGRISREGMPLELRKAWKDIIRTLWSMQMRPGEDGRLEPIPIPAEKDAADALFNWMDATRLEADTAAESGDLSIRSTWVKAQELGGKLTLLVHCLRKAAQEIGPDDPVSLVDVAAGCRLADFFKCHARKAIASLRTDADEKKAQELLAWIIQQGGQVSVRDICRRKPCGLRKRSEVAALLQAMVDLGMGSMGSTDGKRGPKGQCFQVLTETVENVA